MAIKFAPIEAPKPETRSRPAEQIIGGLKEALAVAEGKAEPHKVHKLRPNRASTKTADATQSNAKRRGRPSARTKAAVSIRLDHEVIDHYKATGEGWQSRINAALRKAARLPE